MIDIDDSAKKPLNNILETFHNMRPKEDPIVPVQRANTKKEPFA